MKKRTVSIASEEVDIEIVRSSRRTVALYVRPGGTLLIRAPWYVPVYSLMQFVRDKSVWIIRQRKKLNKLQPAVYDTPLQEDSLIPFMGRDITLKILPGKISRADLRGSELYVTLAAEASPAKLFASVEAWYLREARNYFSRRTDELVSVHSSLLPAPVSVGVRKMKRRWGTCRTNGVIWFNRELMKKRPVLIDYVIIHELCHLVHHNHSRQYYELLERILPDYRQLRNELRGL
jgi:predicted metal-dependent hydrolase